MSYNIDRWIPIAGGPLRISEQNARRLANTIANWRPCEFLEGLEFADDGRAVLDLEELRGECSGNCYYYHMDQIAAAAEGEADFVLVWEGGDRISGLRISGGKVTEMDVVMTLKEKA